MRIDFKPPIYNLHLNAENWSLTEQDQNLAEALSIAAARALNQAWKAFRDGKGIDLCVGDAKDHFSRVTASFGPRPLAGTGHIEVFGTMLESLFERGARAIETFRRDMDGNEDTQDQGNDPRF